MKTCALSMPCRAVSRLRGGFLPVLAAALAAALAPNEAAAQSSYTWNGAGPSGNWSDSANWGGTGPANPQGILNFSGNTQLLNTNDFADGSAGYQVLFNTGAGSFSLWGNSITFYDFGGSPPKIENDSTAPQTVSFPIVAGNNNGGGLQINPVNGSLTIASPVNLNTYNLQIWGNNGNTLSFPAGAILSGTGSTVALNQNSTVVFQDAETYTGDTYVNAGTLQLSANNALASTFVRLGDVSGSAPASLQLDNGQALGSGLNVRSGSSGLKTFGNATNGAGNAIYAGGLYLDASATAYANSNGTLVLAGSPLDLKAQTLTLSGPGSSLVSGTLTNSTGSGTLVKTGTGTAILTGNNVYSGQTIVTAGTLQVGNGGTSGTLGLGIISNVANAGSVAFNRSDSITLNNQFITSSGGGTTFYQNGSGTVTLAGTADNVSCTPVVNAGTLVLGKTSSGSVHAVGGIGTINSGGTVKLGGTGGDQVWSGAGFNIASGGTFDLAGLSESFDSLSGAGTVLNSVAATSGLTLGENGGSSTFTGAIQDGTPAGSKIILTKMGNGTLTLGGNSSYSGGTYLKGGTIAVSADSNLGATASTLTFGAAGLHSTATFASSRAIVMTNGPTLTVDPGTTLTWNGTVSDTAASSASWATLVGGGTLSIKGNTTINNDNVWQVNGGTLEFDPGSSGLLNATNKFEIGNGSGATGTLNIKSGTASFGATDFFVLGDNNSTASGTVNVLGGTMNLYMTSGQRVLVGLAGSGVLNVAGGTVNVASAVGNIQIGGDIQYSGNNASGTLTLSSGAMNVNGSGYFVFGNNSAGKTGATGRLNLFGGTLTSSRNVNGTNGTSSAVLSGGTLKSGVTSTTFFQGFTSASVSTNGFIFDSSTFNNTVGQPLLHDGNVIGVDGGLTKKGTGTLTLSGANTYSGGTYVTAGTLTISSDGNLGAASGGLTLGGTLHATASIPTSRTVTVTNTSTIQIDGSTTLTLNSGFSNPAASGTAGLTVNNGGTLSIKGNVSIANDNAFTANSLTVNVDPGSSGTFNTGGKIVLANASSSTATLNLLSGALNMSAPNEYFAMGDGSQTANGVLNLPSGAMTINALGILFANQGTANINVSGGSLVVSATTGNIQLGGFSQFDANNATGILTLSGTGSVTVNGTGVFELGRNSSTKSGAKGIINLLGGTLTSSRSITGGNQSSFFNFNGGVLAAGGNNAALLQGLSLAIVGTNGALIDSGAFAITIPQALLHDTNAVGFDGGLVKLSSGDLTLAGANTYNGPTLVKAGRLFVNGSLGTNTVTVTNGAALLGAGTINGLVTIQSGATLQPGSGTGIGTLTVNSNVTLAGTTVMLLNKTNAPGASRLVTTANLTFSSGNTLIVTNTGPALQAGDTFILFTAAAYSNALTMVYMPPLASGLEWDLSTLGVNGTVSVSTVPSVTVSPGSTNAECASTVSLVATAGGAPPLIYQWYDNHTNAIVGATNAVLTLTNVSSASAGNYLVVVMNNVDSAYATAAVTVSDTTPPVITLNGANPMAVECHGSFADPGASALDACAGSVPVTVSGSVDPNTPATYTLTYMANDGSGNVTNATRTVVVADTTAPLITWSFTNLTLSVDANCQAVMPDVTGTNYILATDACSTDLSITQTPTNNAVLALGTNEVVLAVADSAGNIAYSTNTIVVADTTAPVITLLGDTSVTNECHTAFVDPGATAADNCSGVVSLSTNNPVEVMTPGVYTIIYAAEDAAGNVATNTRTVYVVDTTLPVVTLNGTDPMTVECHGSFADPGATAQDDCAGTLSVSISGSVDPNNPGSYVLTYSATDPSGNTGTATRTVLVADTTAPVISWSFTNLTLSADTNCQALMPDVTSTNYILAADACSETLVISQTPTNNAMLVLGTNEVVIAVADAAGNTAYSTNTIVVADATAPVLTLLGDNPLTNECHAAFVDPGFSALDNCSGVVSLSTNNPVDANTPGVYTISYVAQDAAGNAATNTRTVFVVDTTAPAITQCVPDQTLIAASDGHTTLPDLTSLLQANDNCSAAVRISQVPPAGTTLSVGMTTVVFYVDDYNLNTNTCSAAVTVNAAQVVPPTITSQQLLDNGNFQLQFTGPNGQTYKLLGTSDVTLPLASWSVVTNGAFGTNAVSYTEPATMPARFFRVTSP